jgi:hypothetical protein
MRVYFIDSGDWVLFFLSNYVIAFGTGGDVYVKGIYIYIYMNVFWFLISITVGSWVDS